MSDRFYGLTTQSGGVDADTKIRFGHIGFGLYRIRRSHQGIFDGARRVHTSLLLKGGTQVGALANLYALSDWSIQQLAVGLAILPMLVALAWYVSRRENMKSRAARPIAIESRYGNRKAA